MSEASDVALNKPLLIAIDGPAAAGKGTLAYREVARGYAYLLAFKTA